jgi:hypothetical protein
MFDKFGITSIVKDFFPKQPGNDGPFKVPGNGGGADKEGCFRKLIEAVWTGPLGCMTWLTLLVGAITMMLGS